jgi:hypothetical protein
MFLGKYALYKAGTQARFTGAMISSPLAAALARRNIHYGWIVVGVTFLTMLVTARRHGRARRADRSARARVRLG